MEKIKRLMHTFPDSDKIFDVKENVAYHVVNMVSDMWEEDGELCLETCLNNFQKATMRISVVDDFAIKVRYSQKYLPKYKFSDHIVNKKVSMPKYKIVNNKIEVKDGSEAKSLFPTGTTGTVGYLKEVEQIEIPFKNNSKKLVITKYPFNMEIYDVKTNKQQMSLNWRDGFTYFGGYTAPGMGFKQTKDDDWMPFLSWEIKNNENFYGLGETFSKVEKTGIRKTIWNTDTSGKSNSDLSYNAIPFVQSTNNWAILLDAGTKSYFDIGASVFDAGTMMNTDSSMEFYLFAGDSLKETTTDYTNLTGRIAGIPDRAYGIWFSRLYYHDTKELYKEIEQAKKYGIPFDVAHIDPKWIKNRYTKSNNFIEATERWGDFEKLYEKCSREEDIEISLWTNPYIQGDNSEFFKTAKENNFLLKDVNGGLAHPHTGVEVYQTDNYLIDLTNKKAYEWYKEAIKTQIKKGARFWVIDYGDGVPEDALFHNGLNGKEMRQYYTFLYKQIYYEATSEILGVGKVAGIARPGYIGSHRFPGKWGGDSYTRWQEIPISIQAGLSLAMAGQALWGTDIGGFIGTPKEELYWRWVSFGSFTPYTRIHGIGAREPWYFGKDDLIQFVKKFFELKRKMIPHYKLGEMEAIEKGIVTMRPLVFDFQDDMIIRKIDDQYMLTSNIMVAPIINPGTEERQVYFPEGNWKNYFTNEKFEGKKNCVVKAKKDEIPVFVKEGSIIVEFSNGSYSFKDIGKQELVVKVFLGQKAKDKKTFILDDKKVVIEFEINSTDKDSKVTVSGWNKYTIKYIK